MDEIEGVLREFLEDDILEVRDEASRALEKYLARTRITEFYDSLTSEKREERMKVVYAAEEMGGEEGLKLLLKAVEDEAEDIRGAAIRILQNHPSAEVLKILVERLPKEKGYVLAYILTVLGLSRRKEFTSILLKFVNHPDYEVQAQAIEALGNIGAPEALTEVLKKAKSKSPSIRKAVATALGSISLTDRS